MNKNDYIKNFKLDGKTYKYYDIKSLTNNEAGLARLPYSIRILLEGALRNYDNYRVTEDHIKLLANWGKLDSRGLEIPFIPSRIILQDFTGVPAVVDLAAMRAEAKRAGKAPAIINPGVPVDLIIDHSVMIDEHGSHLAFDNNIKWEFKRNKERYKFLKWAMNSFENFRVFPPGEGIIHQINLEKLASLVMEKRIDNDEIKTCYPDTLVGTDSHTTMINGLGVVGYGVGGIEAEAAMLGQPIYMPIPDVVGVKLTGYTSPGVTSTDISLYITNILRKNNVVGKFVEYYGPAAYHMPVTNRATIANMSPEYGATMGYFPVDEESIKFMKLTRKDKKLINKIEKYYKENMLFRDECAKEPEYTQIIEIDLSDVRPVISGPKRPQDILNLDQVKADFEKTFGTRSEKQEEVREIEEENSVGHGDVVLAAITSCTNTSNPHSMIGAGLLARNAVQKGLKIKDFTKASLTPGSRVVTKYLENSKLLPYLEALGFYMVGYGCATCIGNSGPLIEGVSKEVQKKGLTVAGVLSGNRNFEGRIHADIKANYLASPMLVIAYAILGRVDADIEKVALGKDKDGNKVYLKDIWPKNEEINEYVDKYVTAEIFKEDNEEISKEWEAIEASQDSVFDWEAESTYVREPEFFMGIHKEEGPIDKNKKIKIENARVLAVFGDSITTDHISPAGAIKKDSPAGKYLLDNGVKEYEFNSYGSRRGNHEVMMRGTFANIRIKNKLLDGIEGGYTKLAGTDEILAIYDAAMKYKQMNVPVIIFAGKEYGTGSSRDWAAKGPYLQGVKAVCARSYERIHRSNLIGMGILPIQFMDDESMEGLGLTGEESYTFFDLNPLEVSKKIKIQARKDNGEIIKFNAILRLDNQVEIDYYLNGGILNKVLRDLIK